MRLLNKILFCTIGAVLLTACSKSGNGNGGNNGDNPGEKEKQEEQAGILEFTATCSDAVSKASFNESSNNMNLSFLWEDRSDMLTAVFSSKTKKFVNWEDSNLYSLCSVKKDASNAKLATIKSIKKLSSIVSGDKVFSISPCNSSDVSSQESSISVNLKMPSKFNQNGLNNLQHLSNYTFTYGESRINEYKKVSGTAFKIIPAIIRFNVSNRLSSSVSVTSVKIDAAGQNGTPANVFPDKLQYSVENNTSTIKESATVSYYSTVEVAASNATIESGKDANFYLYVLPLDDVNGLSKTDYTITVTTSDNKQYTIDKKGIKLDAITGENRFTPGYVYTFDITLESKDSSTSDLYFDSHPEKNSFKSRLMIFQFTSTNCYWCGVLKPKLESVLGGSLKNDIILAGIHCLMGGKYDTNDGDNLRFKGLGIQGIPTLVPNLYKGKEIRTANETVIESDIKNFMNNYCEMSGKVGLAAEAKLEYGQVKIKSVLRSNETNSSYRIAAFLVEDIDGYKNVYRKSSLASTTSLDAFYGKSLGEVKANTYVTTDLSIPNERTVNIDNCKVIVYVTANINNTVNVVNAIIVKVGSRQEFEYSE